MRGNESRQPSMFAIINPESRIPKDHPLRQIRKIADAALAELSPVFEAMYSNTGRPSIPPERLLASSLLMALYSIRSERMFCEQLEYNLLYRWFLRLDDIDSVFDHSTFSANRARLLEHDVAGMFFAAVVEQARSRRLMSDEHFTVDGTLIEAWASLKSFKKKDAEPPAPPDDPGNPTVDFHGEKRSNSTHESTTDPESRLARKGAGKEARLCFGLHALMENRHGLLVDFRVSEANGTAERTTALEMLEDNLRGRSGATVGADKGYDTAEFVGTCRGLGVAPHVARNDKRPGGSTLDGRTTRHAGYEVSQRKRKLVEQIFGWTKTVGSFRKTRYRGVARTQLWAYFVGAAYNILRIAKLECAPT